jgi:hypothetical protein
MQKIPTSWLNTQTVLLPDTMAAIAWGYDIIDLDEL